MSDFIRSFVAFAVFASLCVLVIGCQATKPEEPGFRDFLAAHLHHTLKNLELPETREVQASSLPSLGMTKQFKPPEEQDLWRMSLFEVVLEGLKNSQIVRQNGQFLSVSNSLMDSPDTAPSIFDADIQNNGVLFGSRGTPAAISDFDPKLLTSIQYGRDATVPNNQFLGGGLPPGATLYDESVKTQTRLEQTLAAGGTIAIAQNWSYDDSNLVNRLFPTAFTGDLGFEFRQPLWAGAGEEYTAIAGPI